MEPGPDQEARRMALELLPDQSRPRRRPFYWLPVVALTAAMASWLVVATARERIDQNDRQFASAQSLRLRLMEQRVDDYFGAADQLASVGAATLSSLPDDKPLISNLITDMFRSRSDDRVYGVGAFYAPFRFDPRTRLFGIYNHAWDARTQMHNGPFDHRLPGAIDGIVYAPTDPAAGSGYTRFGWYQRAIGAHGDLAHFGPYEENGRSFISTLKAFYRGRSLLGVMVVDTLTATFKNNLRGVLLGGDVGWIESSGRGHWLLGTAALPPDTSGRIDRRIPLRYTGAYVHLSSDMSALRAADHRVSAGALALVAAIWLLATLLVVGLFQRWRSSEATRALELQRAHLQSEIAVGNKIQVELHKAAFTDGLTGLPNRAAFLVSATDAMKQSGPAATQAVFFIDIDRFNLVNATFGHFSGDKLLQAAGQRLRAEFPEAGCVARLGGDEFALLISTAPDIATIAERILACLREPMSVDGRVTYNSASIGIVLIEPGYRHAEELLRDADIALHEAKARGRARYAIFDTKMRSRVTTESNLENDLRLAIRRKEFVPYYQPIVDTTSGAVVSFEALVRWRRPTGELIEAHEFIGYAERRGLIDAIDMLMLEHVCADATSLFERFPDASAAVNVSAAHLTAPKFSAIVDSVIRNHHVPPARIRLELTETAIMTNADQARATLQHLRNAGIQIILDDFGAGHSSLAYLHRLPIVGLKIDRSFVTRLASDAQAVAIVRSIVALAKTLDLYTVAEGVETFGQLSILKQLDVHYAQGFFFSPALPLEELSVGLNFGR
jgi:diguanylate cyclase (GGDEF)-like protein